MNFDIKKEYVCTTATDYLEDIALMNADAVYGPSIVISEIIGKRVGSNIDVIESPFYPVDDRQYKNVIEGKYIFTFGTLKLMKGIKVIGDSINELLSRYTSIKYVFAGINGKWINENGESENALDYLKRSAGKNADRVIYLGKLKRNEVCDLAEKSEACVLPSLIDNLPNACIEAMASGAIVIGTRGASFEQLIDNEKNGFLVKRDNANELIRTINKVLNLSIEERYEIKCNARLRIDNMDPDKIANETINFYEKVLKGYRISVNRNYYKLLIEKYNREISGRTV